MQAPRSSRSGARRADGMRELWRELPLPARAVVVVELVMVVVWVVAYGAAAGTGVITLLALDGLWLLVEYLSERRMLRHLRMCVYYADLQTGFIDGLKPPDGQWPRGGVMFP